MTAGSQKTPNSKSTTCKISQQSTVNGYQAYSGRLTTTTIVNQQLVY
ncbi:hypothetical protein [Nostoc sp. MS1]|nr:hypothetical protein [Nostoc sp. MS1]